MGEKSVSEEPWGEPEIPLKLVEGLNHKQTFFSRWLPHRLGKEVTCELWRILPCTFRFFLNGRIISGPGNPYWIYILTILLGTTISFMIYDVSPYWESWTGVVNGSIIVFFVSISIFSLVRIVTRDPGYVLPHWFSKQSSEPLLTQNLIYSEIEAMHGYTSYCFICKVFQTPGTYHCNDCNACIDGLDHHCTLLGTCVGRRNYGDFIIFILSSNCSLWFAAVVSLIHFGINLHNHGPGFAFSKCLTVYLILSTLVVPPGGLYILAVLPYFHLRLIFYGLSLEEQKIGVWSPNYLYVSKLPWRKKLKHFFSNFKARVLTPPPPSKIPTSVLQLKVKMPAIPRTPLVLQNHLGLQNIYQSKRIKIKFSSTWMENAFTNYRKRLMQNDIGICGPNVLLIDQELRKIQEKKEKKKRNKKKVDKLPASSPSKTVINLGASPSRSVIFTEKIIWCIPTFKPRKVASGVIKVAEAVAVDDKV